MTFVPLVMKINWNYDESDETKFLKQTNEFFAIHESDETYDFCFLIGMRGSEPILVYVLLVGSQ